MGRFAGAVAALVALARLVVDALLVVRDLRSGGAAPEPVGDPELGGPAETSAPDRAGGVGPCGPAPGPAAREGAGPMSGPATGG
ncbi:MAG TPA: hypothetical protein VFH56_05535 [Acidimicrobiales bacterium]|nr:hypothetical protein [Acidimicrobiales bacterium]